ncbi:MAG: hypothetical protein ACRETA_11110 [Gammaproteobacteria bacterium]
MNKRNLALTLGVAILLAAPLSFASDNANQEISTATTHAGMAANAADVATAHKHFHHVINCLVGPKGKLFDAEVGNPCDGMGNGALKDVKKHSEEHAELLDALKLAEQALHADTLKATQQYAARISKALKAVKPSM